MKYTHVFKCHLVFKCITLIYLFVLECWHWDKNLTEKRIANWMSYCKYLPPSLLILSLKLEPFKVLGLSGNTAQLKLIVYEYLLYKYVSGIVKHFQGLVMSEVWNSIIIGTLAGGLHKCSCIYLKQPVIYQHWQHFARISKLEKRQPFVRRNCNGIDVVNSIAGLWPNKSFNFYGGKKKRNMEVFLLGFSTDCNLQLNGQPPPVSCSIVSLPSATFKSS